MRIAFLSSLNPNDTSAWSGTLNYIFKSLKKYGNELFWIGNDVLSEIRQIHESLNPHSQFLPELFTDYFGKSLETSISEQGFDLIICRDYYFLARLNPNLNIPIIYIADSTANLINSYLNMPSWYCRLCDGVEKMAIHRADVIVYSSRWAKENAISYYGCAKDKIKVVEFGANIPETMLSDRMYRTVHKVCRLLFVATKWEAKGGPIAYETFNLIRGMGMPCKLTIIGCSVDIKDKDVEVIPFIDKSQEKGITKLCAKYREADFFLLPTQFDCYGIVFAEAAAFSVPSVTCNVGGVGQAVRDGINGIVLPAKSKPMDFAFAIMHAYSDVELYKKMRENAYASFKSRMNWKVWGKRMNDIINSLHHDWKSNSNHNLNFFIPTYIINLPERNDRRSHILRQFDGKAEFQVHVIDACKHEVGAIGLWNSICKIIRIAKRKKEDVIIICEDDHYFTDCYNKDYFIENVILAGNNGAELLNGGIGGFGKAWLYSNNLFKVDWFWCTQFIVVYKSLFETILNYQFKESDTADGVLSVIARKKLALFPFISKQKETGYSDVTFANHENPHLIVEHFKRAELRLSVLKTALSFLETKEL